MGTDLSKNKNIGKKNNFHEDKAALKAPDCKYFNNSLNLRD